MEHICPITDSLLFTFVTVPWENSDRVCTREFRSSARHDSTRPFNIFYVSSSTLQSSSLPWPGSWWREASTGQNTSCCTLNYQKTLKTLVKEPWQKNIIKIHCHCYKVTDKNLSLCQWQERPLLVKQTATLVSFKWKSNNRHQYSLYLQYTVIRRLCKLIIPMT